MTTARLAPVPVTTTGVLAGKTVVAIAAGGSAPNAGHSLAVCSDGTVAAWGWNSYGQLGDNSTTTRRTLMAVSTTPLAPESAPHPRRKQFECLPHPGDGGRATRF